MYDDQPSLQSRRRTGRRYVILLFLVFALIGGWVGFWQYAAAKAEVVLEGWRAREAKAGRIYNCGSQRTRGLPVRLEGTCEGRSAAIRRRSRSRPAACWWWQRSISRLC